MPLVFFKYTHKEQLSCPTIKKGKPHNAESEKKGIFNLYDDIHNAGRKDKRTIAKYSHIQLFFNFFKIKNNCLHINKAGKNHIGPIDASSPSNKEYSFCIKRHKSNVLARIKSNTINNIPNVKYGNTKNLISDFIESKLSSLLHKIPERKKNNIIWNE